MHCANCRRESEPAYTLRAHVDREAASERGTTNGREAATDGGEDPVVDLQFCSFECLRTWT